MANVLHRTTKQYIANVEVSDYPVAEWIHDPDVTQLIADRVPTKHWNIVRDVVTEMTPPEKLIIEQTEATLLTEALREQDKQEFDMRVLRAFAEIVVDEFNNLRGLHSLNNRTLGQLRTAIFNKIDQI